MLRTIISSTAVVALSAATAVHASVLFVEDFEAQPSGAVNLNSADPEWRSSHRNVHVESQGGNKLMRTSWDTGTQLIGAQFSAVPLALTEGVPLIITLDYRLTRRDTSRILFGLQGGGAWDPDAHPIQENGTITNFSTGNSNPATHYTADWYGYQAQLRVDGHATQNSIVQKNSGPMDNLGSVWFHNNQTLGTGASLLPDENVWRSAELRMLLNDQNQVSLELWEGADRNSLALVASGLDESLNPILSGYQHVVLGVTNSGAAAGHTGNPIVHLDNITVVPEPTALSALVLAGLLGLRRRRA
jgi:hypothetical protein